MTAAVSETDQLRRVGRVNPVQRALWVVWLAIAVGVPASAFAQAEADSSTLERRVKAAYLYKFAGYVEWPDGTFQKPDTPITIAVAGDDQLAEELTKLVAGRTVDGRALAVRRQSDSEISPGVNILFVARGETAKLRVRAAPQRPVLIVTESEEALNQGSVINFVVDGGRVRFEVSLEGAEQRHIKLSSRLITVAQNMRTGTR
jgi:hypothetical protein